MLDPICVLIHRVTIMKLVLTLVMVASLICTGCASRPPKTCYEMTITLNQRIDKQVICTQYPQTETPFMRKIK